MTFKDQFEDFQRMALELKRLRDHNVSFNADSYELFFFAEGTLVLLALERFLRMILGAHASEKDTLQNLLESATSRKLDLIILPGRLNREETIRRIVRVRNALMHGNYEQAAKGVGLPSKDDYFRSGAYITDVNILYKITHRIVAQIDHGTGQPRRRDSPEGTAFFSSPAFLDLGYDGPGEELVPARLVLEDRLQAPIPR
jgi:hypothetical protein